MLDSGLTDQKDDQLVVGEPTEIVESSVPFARWLDYVPSERSSRVEVRYHNQSAPPPVTWQPVFLDSLSRCANVTVASDEAGLTSKIPYYYKRIDPVFSRAWTAAFEEGVDRIERRLYEHGGEKGFAATRFVATIALLKGRRPSVFGDKVEHSGPGGGPLPLEAMVTEMRDVAVKVRKTTVIDVDPEQIDTAKTPDPANLLTSKDLPDPPS